MQIDVRREDIEEGTAKDTERCPVAHALQRKLGDLFSEREVTVHTEAVCYNDEIAFRHEAPLPDAAQSFIRRVDAGETVEPFSFEAAIDPEIDWTTCRCPACTPPSEEQEPAPDSEAGAARAGNGQEPGAEDAQV